MAQVLRVELTCAMLRLGELQYTTRHVLNGQAKDICQAGSESMYRSLISRSPFLNEYQTPSDRPEEED